MGEGYQILTIDGKEGVNVTAGMEVSEPWAAEGAVKCCQMFDWSVPRPEGMVKNRMFHVESSVCHTRSLGLGSRGRRW